MASIGAPDNVLRGSHIADMARPSKVPQNISLSVRQDRQTEEMGKG